MELGGLPVHSTPYQQTAPIQIKGEKRKNAEILGTFSKHIKKKKIYIYIYIYEKRRRKVTRIMEI